MSSKQLHDHILHAAILGTARTPLPDDIAKITAELGLELPDDPAEALLQLLPITERLARLEPPKHLQEWFAPQAGKPGTSKQPTNFQAEELPPAPAKLSRALDLILGGTYAAAEHEYIRVLKTSGFRPPDRLLPQLLNRALQATGSNRERLLDFVGPRGRWLAQLHPDWTSLYLPKDPNATWNRLHLPADQATFMVNWRASNPNDARQALEDKWPNLDGNRQARLISSLYVGLREKDIPFLSSALTPRRRQVRKEATRLLLKLGEVSTTDHFTSLVAESLQIDGHRIKIEPPKPIKERLEPFGLYEARSSIQAVLLENLPPRLWWELPDLEPFQFVNSLLAGPREAKDLLPPLAKACAYYNDQAGLMATAKMIMRFDLPTSSWPKSLLNNLAKIEEPLFHELSDWALDQLERALHANSLMSYIARSVAYPWSERLSRASLRMLLEDIELSKLRYQNPSSKHWLPLAYRTPLGLFPELQRELYEATTLYGETGKLATKILQIMSFRKRAFGS
ncbi:MAG: DUF5691 domain-containing protein [Bacteroidota bacterium]